VSFSASVLRRYAESARIYLPDGLPPVPPYQGSPGFFRLGALAETLEHLARVGLRDQYEGDAATAIVADVKAMGGVLSADDLRSCNARILPAPQFPWRGHTLQLAGGLTAAPTMMRVLEQMASVRVAAKPDSAWYVAFARAMKQAYKERLQGLDDTDPLAAEACTTHLTVCDQDGTMVAMTTTLLSSMGSRVVLPKTGILMNNGVIWFDPRPNQPNSVAGGKRPLTNISPIIVRDGDRPWLALGASGGRRILASVTQLLSFVMDFGMKLEQAAHHPRIDVSDPFYLSADRSLPREVIEALAADGPTEVVERGVMPRPNGIISRLDGYRSGISDVATPAAQRPDSPALVSARRRPRQRPGRRENWRLITGRAPPILREIAPRRSVITPSPPTNGSRPPGASWQSLTRTVMVPPPTTRECCNGSARRRRVVTPSRPACWATRL
jgi:gamma-glutamyltranspeptidase/glutathione hydrolase